MTIDKDALIDRLKLEAKMHAQEARTANATIAEIYRAVTGSTGEPGNWHGARPVRDALASLRSDAFALQALVAAGHVSQELVDRARVLPGAPAIPALPKTSPKQPSLPATYPPPEQQGTTSA